jgi:hypothetical protein
MEPNSGTRRGTRTATEATRTALNQLPTSYGAAGDERCNNGGTAIGAARC